MKYAVLIAGIIATAVPSSSFAQTRDYSILAVRPYAGLSALGPDADIRGPFAGGEFTGSTRRVLWTPVEVHAAFPGQGGYIRLGMGAALILGSSSYVGVLAGVSRFDWDQNFVAIRHGAPLPLMPRAILEGRVEHHRRMPGGGTAAAVSIRVPLVRD